MMIQSSRVGAVDLLQMLQCGICFERFDDNERRPIMICVQQHTICQSCLNDIMKKVQENRKCPWCRTQVSAKNQQNRYVKMVQNVSGAIIKNKTIQDDLRKNLERKMKQVEEIKVQLSNVQENLSIYKVNEINLREIINNNESDLEQMKKKTTKLQYELSQSEKRQQSLKRQLQKLKEANNKISAKLSEKQKILLSLEREQIELDQSHKMLKDIQVGFYLKLQKLYINDNMIDSIDLSKNTRLEQLGMWNNALVNIDLSKNTRLYYLNIDNNKLEAISLIVNKQLKTISLSGNKLSNLSLSCKAQMEVDIDSQASLDCYVTIYYTSELLREAEVVQSKLKLRYSSYSDDKSTIKKRNMINKHKCNYSIKIQKTK